jgi:hypothetical protein
MIKAVNTITAPAIAPAKTPGRTWGFDEVVPEGAGEFVVVEETPLRLN